jgi:uncharacterized protein YndB with AHSA1/START domain
MVEMKHQIVIKASPEKVYAAIATQAGLRGWWTADSSTDETAGGNAQFGFSKRATVFRMKIDKFEPCKRVLWICRGDHPEWKGTILEWILNPDGSDTILRFTHGNWQSASDYYALCNSTWGELMYGLKDYVEGRSPGPHWKE